MSTNLRRILGIDPGSRQIGVSVFSGKELVFYGIKYFKTKGEVDSLRKLREVITNMTKSYGIDLVAIEKPVFPQQNSAFVTKVFEEVVRCIKQQNIKLIELDPRTAWKIIYGNQKSTKRNTAQMLVKTYKELEPYFGEEKTWSRRYYAQLFDAIAIALAVENSEIRNSKD